jgi:hypothetical protein
MTATFNLEDPMRLGGSHLESLVDDQGRTYFNVFWTRPAEAVFDWPDYVDLPARYLEAAALIQPVLGRPVKTAPALRRWLFSFFEPDGLCYRPETLVSNHWAELFDQARLMYMLTSWAMFDPADKEIPDRLNKLCRGLHDKAAFEKDYCFIEKIGIYFGGTLIRPLLQAGLVLGEPKWIDFAGGLSRGIIDHSGHYGPDGDFEGHHHGHLGTLAGILAWAILKNDDRIVRRVAQIYEWSRSISTPFGFVPEVAKRQDDLIMCETCTLMDYLDVGLLLARHVDEKYWDVVEKAARNHLVEAQVRDASWLAEDPKVPDEEDVLRNDIRRRVTGSFAGWAAPHAQLGAAEEQQRYTWVKTPALQPRYWGKIRALQNCCAGAGIRAMHQVWSNIAAFKDGTLAVNLLIDKKIPEATIRSFIPFEGRAAITVQRDCTVRLRVSAGVKIQDVKLTRNGSPIAPLPDGAFIKVEKMAAGDVLEVRLPLPSRTEDFTIGNPGFQRYKFRAEWKGDTVIAMQADPGNAKTGYSHVMKTQTPLFMGPDAPGPMYRREAWRENRSEITASTPTLDTRNIDWYSLV